MPKFNVILSRMESTVVEVEASSVEAAGEKVEHMLGFEDCSHLEWERIRKSEVIDDIEELDDA